MVSRKTQRAVIPNIKRLRLVVFNWNCKSRRAAERTRQNILPFMEEKLFPRVNRQKALVDYVGRVKFLGFIFFSDYYRRAIAQSMELAYTERYVRWGGRLLD